MHMHGNPLYASRVRVLRIFVTALFSQTLVGVAFVSAVVVGVLVASFLRVLALYCFGAGAPWKRSPCNAGYIYPGRIRFELIIKQGWRFVP